MSRRLVESFTQVENDPSRQLVALADKVKDEVAMNK